MQLQELGHGTGRSRSIGEWNAKRNTQDYLAS